MLAGIEHMDEASKKAFLDEIGLELKSGQDSTAVLFAWMAEMVGAQGQPPAELERAVLVWMAGRLGLKVEPGAAVDQVEADVRRRIAEESQDFLYPFMEVGSAVAYLGPVAVMGPKLELLESSTATLIPSHTARDRLRQYWQARGAKLQEMTGALNPETILGFLKEPLDILKQGSESTRLSVISMAISVALSDGRFEVEEEQFVAGLARHLDISVDQLAVVKKQVGDAFWKHLTALGGGTYKQRSTEEELTLNLRAAQLAMESTGSLRSFSQVVEKGFVGSLHSTMNSGTALAHKLKKLGKTPIRLSIGFATGMLCFIRDRWKSDDHEALLRLVLAAIFQQHLSATAGHAEITEEDLSNYHLTHEVENPAETLAETVVGDSLPKGPVRKISLEPSKFEG